MFTRIGSILPETVKKNGMAPKVARARIFTLFEEEARKILPAEHVSAFKALRFADSTLIVACRSSAAAACLRAEEPKMLEVLKGTGAERIQLLLSPWR